MFQLTETETEEWAFAQKSDEGAATECRPYKNFHIPRLRVVFVGVALRGYPLFDFL